MPRVLEKLESWFFYLFIFAVPFQTRLILHQWTQPFNQWTASYLYGTDILLALLFALWLIRSFGTRNKISNSQFLISNEISNLKSRILNPNLFLFLFFAVSAFSIFNSRIVGLSLYQLLKLAEFIGFYFYLRLAFGKVYKFGEALAVIIASGLFQAIIAIGQYLKQGSLGLRLLGESPLSVNAAGVAVFIADGVKYLRAYGTTPHPNVLAAWLMLAIFAFYFWYSYYFKSGTSRPKNFWWMAVYAILLFGLFFTFSRIIIGLWVLGATIRVLLLFKKNFREFLAAIKQRFINLIATTLIVSSLFAVLFWPQVKSRALVSTAEEAVTQRIFYNKIAESAAISHPLIGVGIGQFVPDFMAKFRYLPSIVYQPVHNIYLLIVSETGFLGLATFLLFLFFAVYNFSRFSRFRKPYHFPFFILIFSFLLMGLFDHFLWTLQQGSLIFWMTLALISLNHDLS